MKAAAIAGLVLAPLLGGCGFDVMYADWKVDRLCKVDGGVVLLSTDVPPPGILRSDGSLDIDAIQRAVPSDPYHVERRAKTLEQGPPEVVRSELILWRTRDQKALATSTTYYRVAQDLGVPLLARQAHVCPADGGLESLISAAFSVGKK